VNAASNHKPQNLNLDANPKYLPPGDGYYLLNNQSTVNPNGSNNGAALGKSTPLAANYPACEMDTMPVGENHAPNTFESRLTNELYSWVLNSNGANYLQRLNAKGECEIVYQHLCLALSADPKHQITQSRAYMRLEKKCANRDGKYIVWTDGNSPVGHIDTEAAIATDSFSTDFFDICRDDCAYVQLCVPEICGCISGEFVPLPVAEKSITNHLVDVPIQIAVRHITYDQRANEWSDWTTTFFQDSKGCFDSAEGLSRCLKLRIPIGNPTIDKIEVAYSKDGGVSWFLYDTIEKYKKYNSAQEKWYQRQLSEVVTTNNFSTVDCAFDYFFCNDKQCQSIDKKEFTRVRNPLPRFPQTIIEVKNSIGFINYEDGVCPIDKIEAQKVSLDIECTSNNCVTDLATITVRAIIHNAHRNTNQFIYRYGGEGNEPDDYHDTAYFGGLNIVALPEVQFNNGYLQDFREKTRNFIVYIDGTGYAAEMKQKLGARNLATAIEVGVVNNMNDNPTAVNRYDDSRNTHYFQEVKIKVPKGTAGFLRLTSHKATSGDEDQSTSVIGTLNNIENYSNAPLNAIGYTPLKEEIYFNTCDGDVDLKEAFVINDLATNSKPGFHSAVAYSGYIRDSFGLPIEGAEIWGNGNVNGYILRDKTDHNGYYSFATWDEDLSVAEIRVERDCGAFRSIEVFNIMNGSYGMNTRDYEIKNQDYQNNHYTNVNVYVKDCDGLGVGGIRISLSGSKNRSTGADGIARFKVRNYSNRQREVRAVLINLNGCITAGCNGNCNPCMDNGTSSTPTCYTNTDVSIGDFIINRDSLVTKSGLKAGGRYPFGFVVKGNCGRVSAVNEIKYIDIPKTQDKNKVGFCTFSYDGGGIQLPDWANCVSIVRGENLNPFELQWVVDKIQREDGKIKITIQSLNDYNEKYIFKSNTVYQWLKNDRIEFIRNGDGSVFTTAQFGSLNYLTLSPFHDELISGDADQPADFFNQLLILDDGRLSGLTEGALIEIQRSKECVTEPSYREICVSIPVVQDANGKNVLLYPTGTFTTFDTFLVNRIIGKFPLMTFEHHSPSDFWGNRVSDVGKAHFLNPYENEQRYGRNVTINSPTQFNYFGDLVKRFDAPGQGDITAAYISDGRVGLFICEHDSFIAEVADDLVRVGSDGTIRALPAEAIISDGQPKLIGQFGCQYPHIGSVLFGDGWATYWDVNKHGYIIHNYQYAKRAGESTTQSGDVISQCNTYFQKRSQELESLNRNEPDFYNHLRFCTGYNKTTGDVYLTIKSLRHSAINNEIAPYLKPNETLIYHPTTDNVKGFASFTPEGYGNMNLFDGSGCAFISFSNAIPYIHPIIADKWNEFYGITCDWILGICLNQFATKEKVALALEIQSETMWFVKDVRTEKPAFISEIPPIKFKKNGYKWNGAFMGNSNSRDGLHKSTELPKGYYVKVLLVRDNTVNNVYNSINPLKRTQYSEIDGILIKFVESSQSGFDSNL
jgi:hypothetical protein